MPMCALWQRMQYVFLTWKMWCFSCADQTCIGDTTASHYGTEQPPTCLKSVFNSFKWTHLCLRALRFRLIFSTRLSEEISYHTAVRIFPMTNKLIWTKASLHASYALSWSWILGFGRISYDYDSVSFLLPFVCFAGGWIHNPPGQIISLRDWLTGKNAECTFSGFQDKYILSGFKMRFIELWVQENICCNFHLAFSVNPL